MQVQSMFEVSHDDTNIARTGQEYVDQMRTLIDSVTVTALKSLFN
jgi:hypothetical protein